MQNVKSQDYITLWIEPIYLIFALHTESESVIKYHFHKIRHNFPKFSERMQYRYSYRILPT